jgi:hypothetical protein
VKDVDLHEVSTRNMGRQLIEIGQKTDNTVLKVRLSSIESSNDPLAAVAEDMKYHLPCPTKARRESETTKNRSSICYNIWTTSVRPGNY